MHRRTMLLAAALLAACELPNTPMAEGGLDAHGTEPADSVAADWCHVVDCGHPARFPIHLYYDESYPQWMREVIDEAAEQWSRVLAPTPTQPYVFATNRNYRILGGGEPLPFAAGDTLAPGAHIYLQTEGCAGWDACAGKHVVGSDSTGHTTLGIIVFTRRPADTPRIYSTSRTALHEMGHVFGVAGQSGGVYTDSLAIRVFDAMGGTDYPGPKVPLQDFWHWEGCAGHADLMSYGGYTLVEDSLTADSTDWFRTNRASLTPLSLASLDSHLEVNWHAPVMKPLVAGRITGHADDLGMIDSTVWNDRNVSSYSNGWHGGCRDGLPIIGGDGEGMSDVLTIIETTHGHPHPND